MSRNYHERRAADLDRAIQYLLTDEPCPLGGPEWDSGGPPLVIAMRGRKLTEAQFVYLVKEACKIDAVKARSRALQTAYTDVRQILIGSP